MQNQHRQLVAILFTDIVGYTAMMQQNEAQAVVIVKRYISVLQKTVSEHAGSVLNDYGDGSLCTFSSATQAVHCAILIQQQLQIDPKVPLRIGVHVGEIFFEDGKVLGDGVNVASRIQSLGQANTILFSKEVCDKIRNQPEFNSVSLGRFEFKNVHEPMEVFALTNEGLVVPKRSQVEGKLKKKNTSKTKLLIAASLLVLIIASFFIYKKSSSAGFSDKEKSIAILPFEVIGNNEDNLASGLVEDILVHLSKIKEFDKVISNKSSSQYRNTKKDLKEIGEELGSVFLVTGSIQQSGDKIRVSVQLVDSRSGKTIWADDYTKENVEIFDLQTELATQIVSALKTKITPEEKLGLSKRYTDNVEAYKFYRKGRSFWDQRTKASYDSAEVYYKKAIDLDPDYALAYSGLADCYTFNQKGLSQPESIPIARDYATKALSLDSTLVEARTTIAFIQSHYDYDWKGSAAIFKKIISDNPNYSTAHVYYGNVLLSSGKYDEAIAETKKALALDPLSAVINYVLGREYYYIRRYDSAIIQLQKNITLNPKFVNSYVPLGAAYVQKKIYNKAIDVFSKLPKTPWDLGSDGRLYLAYAYALSGDMNTAKNIFEKISAEDLHQCPNFAAYVYISFGDFSTALTQLEYALQVHAIQVPFMKLDPVFDPIRNEPRFKLLLEKANLN
jgi:adenylate cyclase